MKGDVKGLTPAAGDWFAVYAKEGRIGRRPLRESDFGTEPVMFWLWTEQGDAAEFVGVVSLGPHLISADDPYLLGYARKGDSLRKKFGAALRTLKRSEKKGGYPESERETLSEMVRRGPVGEPGETFPCPACVKGVSPEGEECDVCGGVSELPITIEIEDLSNGPLN